MRQVFVLCGAVLLLLPTLGFATTLTVQVEQGQLRSDPSFFSKIITKIPAQSSVELIEEHGAWRLVKFKNQQGWMHVSAVTKGKLSLISGKTISDAVSGKEVSLAGKGFTKEVENEFKKNHRELSFTWVDKMEKINITASELEKFAAKSDFSTVSR